MEEDIHKTFYKIGKAIGRLEAKVEIQEKRIIVLENKKGKED